jgi:NADH-quinone oxidoreductase subunit N
MNSTDLIALSPLGTMAIAPILVMLAIAVRRSHTICLTLSLISLCAVVLSIAAAASVVSEPRQVTELIVVDLFGLFYMLLALTVTAAVLIIGVPYLANKDSQPEEYYVLLLCSLAGSCVMAASTHFMSFYLGLEILSVSQYGLVAYIRREKRGTEAGLKYLILAAASAAFLLFGMALVYSELGSMDFVGLAHATSGQLQNNVVALGVAMMFVGIGFKLSIVPLHMWTPDIYQGAPVLVVAFASTVSKFAVLAVLLRYFSVDDAPITDSLASFVALTAGASMIVGNLLALLQNNIKRLLAYSSIAHMGYVSVAFLAAGSPASVSVAFYAVAYSAASVGAFGVVSALSARTMHGEDAERIEDYRGLFWSQPVLAGVLAVCLLSLTGIPLTAGFLGKFMVLFAGAQTSHWVLLVILAASSTVGAYYYLRIVAMLFMKPGSTDMREVRVGFLTATVLLVLAFISVFIGVYPSPVLHLIDVANKVG